MMETTGSGRLDNGNRNEPERRTFDDGVRNEPGKDKMKRKGEKEKRKGKVKMNGKGENEWGKRKGTVKTKGIFRRFGGSLDKPEFNISKVQRSLDVWNLTFRRFTPASTLALNI
ncbi:hypothetical protein RIR_jg7654.t1 [Rhizophagus irregularis DAOM 181602=DAOM 197198]|nr:hypothetical protein RIR_jg7654.t1 [Rhizophagus irregularis DAOM 181602=DAOM 197198]